MEISNVWETHTALELSAPKPPKKTTSKDVPTLPLVIPVPDKPANVLPKMFPLETEFASPPELPSHPLLPLMLLAKLFTPPTCHTPPSPLPTLMLL